MTSTLIDPTDFVAFSISDYTRDVHMFARIAEVAVESVQFYSYTYNKFMNTPEGTVRIMLIGHEEIIREPNDIIRTEGIYKFPDLSLEHAEMVALNLRLGIPLYTLHDHANYGESYALLLSKCQ